MEEIIEELKKRLTIEITRFDNHYIEIELKIDGEYIDGAGIGVPAYEIRENFE